jgi:hypothetical protein
MLIGPGPLAVPCSPHPPSKFDRRDSLLEPTDLKLRGHQSDALI